MPDSRRADIRKHLSFFAKGIGAVALVVIVVASIIMFSCVSPPEKKIVAQQTPAQPQQTPVQQVAEEEFEEPTDPSGEINGKWYGLCQKNSIQSVEDFRRTVADDSVLAEHFSGFNWENAKLGEQDEETKVHVSYRKDNVIRQTSKLVKLPKGDRYITDGTHIVRTACCNDYVVPPPVSPAAGKNIPPVYPPDVTPSAGGTPVQTVAEALNLPPDYVLSIVPNGWEHYEREHPPITPPLGPAPVPEPATMLLFGSGLTLLAAAAWKKRRHE